LCSILAFDGKVKFKKLFLYRPVVKQLCVEGVAVMLFPLKIREK